MIMFYKNRKVIFLSSEGDTDFLDFVVGVLLEDTFAPYMFLIWLQNVQNVARYNKRKWFYSIKKQEADDSL